MQSNRGPESWLTFGARSACVNITNKTNHTSRDFKKYLPISKRFWTVDMICTKLNTRANIYIKASSLDWTFLEVWFDDRLRTDIQVDSLWEISFHLIMNNSFCPLFTCRPLILLKVYIISWLLNRLIFIWNLDCFVF